MFPVHPRTRARLAEIGLSATLEAAGVRLGRATGLCRLHGLVEGAAAVMTDSGGIQEETTYLGIPCLTLRENTERPITSARARTGCVEPEGLADELHRMLATPPGARRRPDLWDGHTAGRCVEDLRRRTAARRVKP